MKRGLLRTAEGGLLMFWCPGCDSAHAVRVFGRHGWSFNNDYDAPTFTPSVLVRTGHHADGDTTECWCTYEARTGQTPAFACTVCHSFVTDGRIEFLDDCTHALAGQTVPLPDWPEEVG